MWHEVFIVYPRDLADTSELIISPINLGNSIYEASKINSWDAKKSSTALQ